MKFNINSEKSLVLQLFWILPIIPMVLTFILSLFYGYFFWILILIIVLWGFFGWIINYYMSITFEIKEDYIIFKDCKRIVIVKFEDILYLQEEKLINKNESMWKIILKEDIKISKKYLTILNKDFYKEIQLISDQIPIVKRIILE